ncbi:hypothetical protein GALMADRAFT_1304697 [Galerina marginata CBS 339.88]|uniref:Uncharacterized protein n=1 Tax=Galerina marginata (strain CBS 339.88) TaxID=685588 RepID=A0A067TE41_GALM3|nr:hypothetical protein GALMADRAFT_1304697 [Galerina marginata CBS 339.88]
MSSTTLARPTVAYVNAEWAPRRELALPNELLYKVILLVISESVHSICVSTEDTTWERGVMDTLHQVSGGFKAISSEIAVKAFDIPKIVRQHDASLLRTLREIFIYLSRLGMRLRHPSDWGGINFQTIDCKASSFVFGYALYLSCISLRRNASRSPREVFESTHKVILSALAQSEALCGRVFPVEMTYRLRSSIEEEFGLARHGLVIVQSFNGTGPVTAVRSLIHTSLHKIEAVHEEYDFALADKPVQCEPRIYELPGVLASIRLLAKLKYDEDEYNLEERVRKFVDLWKVGCPFLNKEAKRRVEYGV